MPPREGCRFPLNLRAPPGTASWPKLNGDDPPPSLHEHYNYTRFIATTRQFVPLRRIGTFGLAVGAACAFSLGIARQVLTFHTTAWSSFALPTRRMPLGPSQGISQADPGGKRWHARAFDRESEQFRDFVLGRLSKVKIADEAGSATRDDADWRSFVSLIIAPHPGLTPAQSRAIAIDYEIRGRSTSIEVRRALLFYALKRLGLDVAPDIRPATEQHIVLLNRSEVDSALSQGKVQL